MAIESKAGSMLRILQELQLARGPHSVLQLITRPAIKVEHPTPDRLNYLIFTPTRD